MTIYRFNSKTFANLYKTSVSTKKRALNYENGQEVNTQEVDMRNVLKHELSRVPLSLAKTTSTCKMNTKIGTNNYNNQ